MGHIDWTKDAVSIERLVRGLNPWPSAYTSYAGKTMKIWSAEVTDLPGERAPGKIHVTKDRLFLETGEGVLDVKELQLEGKMPRAVLKIPAEKPAAGTTETRSKGEMFYVRNVWLRLWLWS